MSLNNHDQEATRQYLLGQLTGEEEIRIEERLLTEDDLFEELEVTKDDLVEEYLANELTHTEREWFEQNFLASPEGKGRQTFARTLNRYVLNHPIPQKKPTWSERVGLFWSVQTNLFRTATAIAVILVVVGIFWISRAPRPQNLASLTLNISSSTRSSGTESPKVKLTGDGLRLTLVLPASATPGARYRVDLINDKGETKTLYVTGQNAQSLSVEVPAAQLPVGQYAVTLSSLNADGAVQRIPGSFYFTVE
jgi:hypothetical protein